MITRSAFRPAAIAFALLALAAPSAGCREERPLSEAITTRLLEAAQNPRASHLVSTSGITVTMPYRGQPVMTMHFTMDTEQWTRDAEHVRSESTVRMAFDAAGGEDGDFMAQMLSAMGMDAISTTSVRNGPLVSWHESMMNTYSTVNVADLPADEHQPSQAEMADMLRTSVKDLVTGYLLNPLEDRVVAGRPAFAMAVVPRNADSPSPVFYFFRVQNGVVVVDKETYEVLALEGEGLFDVAAGAARIRSEGSSGPFDGMERAFEGSSGGEPIPMAISLEVSTYELNPELPDELFAFAPPEGATQIDPLAMATMSAAMAEQGAVDGALGEDSDESVVATAVAETMATAMADPEMADLFGGTDVAPAPPATTSGSAEVVLAGNALRELAPNAAFTVLTPDYVPPGCAATESGSIPGTPSPSSPARMLWVVLTCPTGALRIEEKAANDSALSFEEADSERLTVMVAGDRVPYFRRPDGSNSVLVSDQGGTSFKVSGPQDVTFLVRIAESMR